MSSSKRHSLCFTLMLLIGFIAIYGTTLASDDVTIDQTETPDPVLSPLPIIDDSVADSTHPDVISIPANGSAIEGPHASIGEGYSSQIGPTRYFKVEQEGKHRILLSYDRSSSCALCIYQFGATMKDAAPPFSVDLPAGSHSGFSIDFDTHKNTQYILIVFEKDVDISIDSLFCTAARQ